MNATVYVFSKLNGKYSQYPDDYTRTLFDRLQSLSSAAARMVIHREGELMYYGYIRRLTRTEDYMGFCILLNGVMLTRIEQLAAVFEKAFDEANVFFTVEMAESVSAMIQEGVAQMECEALPPVAYGIARGAVKVFKDTGDNDEIVRAAAVYPYVVVENNLERNVPTEMKRDMQGVTDVPVATKQRREDRKLSTILGRVLFLFFVLIGIGYMIGCTIIELYKLYNN